tara:strand:+ start:1956 stop:2612 length:657 start_codon:yes stop_codon:yes gene_type:complete
MSESMEYIPRYPHLDDVAEFTDVATKGSGSFAASYIPWAKIAHHMRKHANGWQPTTQPDPEGNMLHTAPDGTHFLMCGFVHPDLPPTQFVPHAVMDHRMKAKKNPDARDISDAFVRGMCKAAALLFGLGWQLWSKDDPLEREEEPVKKASPKPKPKEVLDTFPLKEHALSALAQCKTKEDMRKWGIQVKVSKLVGQDLADLREAGQERLAVITEAEQE